MKIEILIFQPGLLDQVIPMLSALQLPDKASVSVQLVVSPKKPSQSPVKNIIRNRDFHVIQKGENTLQCKENGQMIPSTHEGAIDLDQLAHEILQGKWIPRG